MRFSFNAIMSRPTLSHFGANFQFQLIIVLTLILSLMSRRTAYS